MGKIVSKFEIYNDSDNNLSIWIEPIALLELVAQKEFLRIELVYEEELHIETMFDIIYNVQNLIVWINFTDASKKSDYNIIIYNNNKNVFEMNW